MNERKHKRVNPPPLAVVFLGFWNDCLQCDLLFVYFYLLLYVFDLNIISVGRIGQAGAGMFVENRGTSFYHPYV